MKECPLYSPAVAAAKVIAVIEVTGRYSDNLRK
jgi:hypothetical protein